MDTTKEIEYVIENIRKDLNILNVKDLEEKYKEFKDKYTKTYEMVTSPSYDGKYMSYLLKKREELNGTNNLEISKEVGIAFAKDFIYPITGDPTNKELERANRIVNMKDKLA